jgi:hypothetical protein
MVSFFIFLVNIYKYNLILFPKLAPNSFYMSRYLITQREYQEITGTNPSLFRGDNIPVENVSWWNEPEKFI